MISGLVELQQLQLQLVAIDRMFLWAWNKWMSTCRVGIMINNRCLEKHVLCALKISLWALIVFVWRFARIFSMMIVCNNGWRSNRIVRSVDRNSHYIIFRISSETPFNIRRFKLFKSSQIWEIKNSMLLAKEVTKMNLISHLLVIIKRT